MTVALSCNNNNNTEKNYIIWSGSVNSFLPGRETILKNLPHLGNKLTESDYCLLSSLRPSENVGNKVNLSFWGGSPSVSFPTLFRLNFPETLEAEFCIISCTLSRLTPKYTMSDPLECWQCYRLWASLPLTVLDLSSRLCWGEN